MQGTVASGISHPFRQLSQSEGQITHVLLTRSPLEYPPKEAFPLDLHVLSTPPAFFLSQYKNLNKIFNLTKNKQTSYRNNISFTCQKKTTPTPSLPAIEGATR